MYGIDSVIISQYSLKKLDKTESKLVKHPIGESNVRIIVISKHQKNTSCTS